MEKSRTKSERKMSQTKYERDSEDFSKLLSKLIKEETKNAVEIMNSIKDKPSTDTDSRCRLIVLACHVLLRDEMLESEYTQLIAQQVIWFINNEPEHPVLASPFAHGPLIESIPSVREAWLQLTEATNSAIVLAHASNYFYFENTPTSLELLHRALATGTNETKVWSFAEMIHRVMTESPNTNSDEITDWLNKIKLLLDERRSAETP